VIWTSAKDNHQLHTVAEFRCCRTGRPQPPAMHRRFGACLTLRWQNEEPQPRSRTGDILSGCPSQPWTETVRQGRYSRKTCRNHSRGRSRATKFTLFGNPFVRLVDVLNAILE